MAVRHCVTCRRTFYSEVEGRTIALGWVCFDCRKDRERQDVLSQAECPRCSSKDVQVTTYAGDNYNFRCKNCPNEWTEVYHRMTKQDK